MKKLVTEWSPERLRNFMERYGETSTSLQRFEGIYKQKVYSWLSSKNKYTYSLCALLDRIEQEVIAEHSNSNLNDANNEE